METTGNPTAGDFSRFKIKEETKHVLEAFLKRSLSQDDKEKLGHVGRVYHDPKKYIHRTSSEEIKDGGAKRGKKSDRRRKDVGKEKDERSHSPTFGEDSSQGSKEKWNSLHDEITRVEETKHDFKTNIKKLLRRQSQTKEKASTPKDKNGSVHSKSKDSIESLLDEHGRIVAKGDSLKRPKSPNPLLACTVAASTISLPTEDQKPSDAHEKHGGQRKPSLPFSLKMLKLKKKTPKENKSGPDTTPARPDFLPVTSCFDVEYPSSVPGKLVDSELYTLAAKQLDTLIKHKKVKSPVAPPLAPAGFAPVPKVVPPPMEAADNNNRISEIAVPEDKEEVIRKLVALLQEQAVVINEKINNDPFLRKSLTRMSYNSFSRLAEVFTSQAEVESTEVGASVSPELTKIALTMELTRKVAGINSHAVHQLMGYSLQYMDMFVPWLQKQGGWENIVSHGDISDLQID